MYTHIPTILEVDAVGIEDDLTDVEHPVDVEHLALKSFVLHHIRHTLHVDDVELLS